MELSEEQKLNLKLDSTLGIVFEILGIVFLLLAAVLTPFLFVPRSAIPFAQNITLVLIFTFIALLFQFIGKVLHYLRKTSVLTCEILEHLKEKDMK